MKSISCDEDRGFLAARGGWHAFVGAAQLSGGRAVVEAPATSFAPCRSIWQDCEAQGGRFRAVRFFFDPPRHTEFYCHPRSSGGDGAFMMITLQAVALRPAGLPKRQREELGGGGGWQEAAERGARSANGSAGLLLGRASTYQHLVL